MLALRLPEDIESRLDKLAKATGRTKSFYAREAILEHLADLVANGELEAEYIPVESEHSALSACLGSSATGARTFTATAGQGANLAWPALLRKVEKLDPGYKT